ncbi:MAG: hypothetical protein HGB18_04645 [Candidatus Moranbacteria bacterium]|nr:hypothetical protein [Candidatus Moranbacteria bacterium]
MGALSMAQKAIIAGVGILAVGMGAGYWIGRAPGTGYGWGDGRGMMRENRPDGFGRDQGDPKREARGWGDGSGRGSGLATDPSSGRAQGGPGMGMDSNRESCLADECLSVDGLEYPVGSLSDEAKSAVLSAIDDEYKAFSTYEAVMAKLGRVRPFSMIAGAEEQHIASLKAVLEKYGVAVPENPYLGKIAAPDTLQSACQAGYDAEVGNASLYRDSLLLKISGYPDIVGVFTNLMNASQDRHLPAFERCK